MVLRARCFSCLIGLYWLPPSVTAWINSGTPTGVPEEYDCALRQLVYKRGQQLLPERGEFRSLFDALQLQNCGMMPPTTMDSWTPSHVTTASLTKEVLHVDPANGNDFDSGSLEHPVKSLERAAELAAVKAMEKKEAVTISLHGGTHYLHETLQLSEQRFPHGVHLVNHGGERAAVSGGQPIALPKSAWEAVRRESGWKRYQGWDNIFGLVPHPGKDSDCCRYLGSFETVDECEAAASSAEKNGSALSGFVWYESGASTWEHRCYSVMRPHGFLPVQRAGAISGRKMATNLWKANLSSLSGKVTPALQRLLEGEEGLPGLRLNGRRAIRAKYPDGSPEQTGQLLYGEGQSMGGGAYVDAFIREGFATWAEPRSRPPAQQVVITAEDWPGVNWPMRGPDNATVWHGMGDSGEFFIGIGGTCDDVSPPAGYWCGPSNPRHVQAHNSPSGLQKASTVLPHFRNYSDTGVKPVINGWRGGGRWFTWQFLVDTVNTDADSLTFSPTRGGNQGAEGVGKAGPWWIENVLEECDSPDEFFYDAKEKTLYFSFNGTDYTPDGSEAWTVPVLQTVINVSSSHSSISGIELRDSQFTYLEPHGLPSGGDWALERAGAIFISGVDNVTVQDCLLTQLDGNGIFLSGRVKNATLRHNEFSLIGASAMAAWGMTTDCLNADCSKRLPAGSGMGPDGRGMDVPWGTRVENNLVQEIGLWQKQSSMWFQAVTAESQILRNVHFNGPRAGINFNDGFGGGDIVSENLVGNCVRESGDHGPFNSWDRVPYITTLRNGEPSTQPKFRHFTQNLWFGTYATQTGVDNDDGSAFYRQDSNVFVYGSQGLKSDFGGHDNKHTHNMYLFVQGCYHLYQGHDGTGARDAFANNVCLLSPGGAYQSDCGNLPWGMEVHNNTVHTNSGDVKVCGGQSLNHYVRESGKDSGSSVSIWPAASKLVAAAERLLNPAALTVTYI